MFASSITFLPFLPSIAPSVFSSDIHSLCVNNRIDKRKKWTFLLFIWDNLNGSQKFWIPREFFSCKLLPKIFCRWLLQFPGWYLVNTFALDSCKDATLKIFFFFFYTSSKAERPLLTSYISCLFQGFSSRMSV